MSAARLPSASSGILELKEATEHYSFLQLHAGDKDSQPEEAAIRELQQTQGSPEQRAHSQAEVGTVGSPQYPTRGPDAQATDSWGRPRAPGHPGWVSSTQPSPKSDTSHCGRSCRHHLMDGDTRGTGHSPPAEVLIESSCVEVEAVTTTGRNVIPGLLSLTAQRQLGGWQAPVGGGGPPRAPQSYAQRLSFQGNIFSRAILKH